MPPPIDPRYGRTHVETESGPVEIATADSATLYRIYDEYSDAKVLGNTRLNGPESGKLHPENVETDPLMRLIIQRGVLDLLFDIQALQQELLSRPDGKEMMFSRLMEAQEKSKIPD